jgi:hypothetical protein
MTTPIFTSDDHTLILLYVEMAMKRTNRTDRATAFSAPGIRSSMLVEPCFDLSVLIPQASSERQSLPLRRPTALSKV